MREKKVEKWDVVIIGGGPAGLTAGIYCGRARLKTIIIEKALIGGLATYTNEIENYPGFPEGSGGLDLMNLFKSQAKKFNVSIKLTDVKSVELSGDIKTVETFRTKYEAKVVIIASGGRPRITNATNEDKFLFDKGISFCATCDAAANTGKDILIIGSGDTAIEEGMFLTKFANKVYVSVMHDCDKMDCNEIAKEAAQTNQKMEFLWNTVVDSFEGGEHLEKVMLKNLKTGELVPLEVDTCFEFIGYLPNTEIFKDKIDLTDRGYVRANEKMETNIEGVFSIGDVNDKYLKQVATAVGDGAIAGYGSEKYIAESEIFSNLICKTDKPVVLYFYNAIDEKSREVLTIMEKIKVSHGSKMHITMIDIYKSKGMASRLDIDDFPCVAILKNGKTDKVIYDNINEETILSAI
ncbi:MAG: FAD-dependent oxidoreductase [Actinomycetia bacterium]|nr:FAD-dependent oxidoreductase [Actinomycetes bacterium]